MASKGVLTVISGFSGVGKGTVMKQLLSKYDHYRLSVSATTRKPRPGETHGVEYFFLTKEEFQSMIENDGFLEWAQYVDSYYGTPREYVENILEQGHDIILEIEMQGALQVKKQYPQALLLFIVPPDFETLKERLYGRQTEGEATILKRLARCYEEAEVVKSYDYMVVNDEVDNCVEKINELIVNEHKKPIYNIDVIEEIKENAKKIRDQIF